MFWATIIFAIAVIGVVQVAIAWVEKDKPYQNDPQESIDGYLICPSCQHIKCQPHTKRVIKITEETL